MGRCYRVLSMEEFVASMRIPLEDGSMKKDDLPEMFNIADTDGSGVSPRTS